MPPNPAERVSFRDSDHSYTLDGKRLPSVTTILGNLSKPGLVWWSAKEGAKAVKARILELADVDPPEGFDPDPQIDLHTGQTWDQFADELYELARTAHSKRLNAAAKKGTTVHDAIQTYHEDFFAAVPPEEPAELAAWENFVEWWGSAGLRCVDTERKIVGPDNRYAGRLDMLCADVVSGDLYVCDLKTSNGVHPEHVYQNAGYAAAIEAEGEHVVAGTKVIWLPEGADRCVVIERDREEWLLDFAIFDSLITVHAHRKGLDKWLAEIKAIHGPEVPA